MNSMVFKHWYRLIHTLQLYDEDTLKHNLYTYITMYAIIVQITDERVLTFQQQQHNVKIQR